jgi:hypothetical protein
MEDWREKGRTFEDPVLVELFEKETDKYWKDLVKAIKAIKAIQG